MLERRLAAAVIKISRVVEAAEAQQNQHGPSFVEQIIAEHDDVNGFAGAWDRHEQGGNEQMSAAGIHGKLYGVTEPVNLGSQTSLTADAAAGSHRGPNHYILSRALIDQSSTFGILNTTEFDRV